MQEIAMSDASTLARLEDRLLRVERMRVGDIAAHARNPKRHPVRQQDALKETLRTLGQADVLKAYHSERNGGALTLYDGHARQGLDPEQEWHVAIFDLTDAEADDWLRYADPIAALAEVDNAILASLLEDASTDSTLLAALLSERAAGAGLFTGTPVDPNELWKGMPDFEQEDVSSWKSIHVHFENAENYQAFAHLVEQSLTEQTRAIWYPFKEKFNHLEYQAVDES